MTSQAVHAPILAPGDIGLNHASFIRHLYSSPAGRSAA